MLNKKEKEQKEKQEFNEFLETERPERPTIAKQVLEFIYPFCQELESWESIDHIKRLYYAVTENMDSDMLDGDVQGQLCCLRELWQQLEKLLEIVNQPIYKD